MIPTMALQNLYWIIRTTLFHLISQKIIIRVFNLKKWLIFQLLLNENSIAKSIIYIVFHTFRTVQQVPFKMLCASFDQLKVGVNYMNKTKEKTVIHMDSSGKFLPRKGKKKKLLNTAIVIPPPAPGHAPFSIMEMISEDNRTIDFKIFLQTGWSLLSNAIGDGEVANPSIAVTDCAFPNIHSLMSTFNQIKLTAYLEECHQ